MTRKEIEEYIQILKENNIINGEKLYKISDRDLENFIGNIHTLLRSVIQRVSYGWIYRKKLQNARYNGVTKYLVKKIP